jgi:hypothetical protein
VALIETLLAEFPPGMLPAAAKRAKTAILEIDQVRL